MDDVMTNEIERKTTVLTTKVTYHINWSLTYPYVDISWWAADLPVGLGGDAVCKVYLSGSSCDHSHVRFDDDAGQTPASKRQKVCHEIMHTLGADDGSSNGGCIGGGPDGTLNSHDISHINSTYGH